MVYLSRGNNPKGSTHTHKTISVIRSHRKVKEQEPINQDATVRVPESSNAIIISDNYGYGQDNGNPSGQSKSQSQSDFSFFEWATTLGVVITEKHREMARRTLIDPTYRKEKFAEYKNI